MASKKQLIDREKLLDKLHWLAKNEDQFRQSVIGGVMHTIAVTRTVDAVEVVRCKDCKYSKLPAVLTQKYGEPGTLTCYNWHSPCNKRNVNAADFCSRGERMVEE